MHLSVQQINHLIAGNCLAAEVSASAPALRRFIDICGYTCDDRGHRQPLSGILSQEKRTTALFCVRDYEIAAAYIENGWDAAADECARYRCKDGIVGIAGVELELAEHLSDFTRLVPEWKTDAPL